jgi:uncharacterized protein
MICLEIYQDFSRLGSDSMANGHGGARPGAGRPPKSPANDNPKTIQNLVSDASAILGAGADRSRPPDKRPLFSDASVHAILEAIQQNQQKSRNRPRTEDWNPYKIRPELFGPVAQHIRENPEAKARKLAMDDNSALINANGIAMQAWMNGGMMSNAFSEGLLFMGYPYLSELIQRPEFRLFGEIKAEEMTRKWTQFRGTDDESTKEQDKPVDRNKDDEESEERKKALGQKPRSDKKNKEIEAKIKELLDFENELKVRAHFKAVANQDSDFGISHLFLDLEGTDLERIRDPELATSIGNGRNKVTESKLGGARNFLKGMRTIEPIWCYPTTYNAQNPLVSSWYDPSVWYVMGAEVHKTRLLSFIGRPVPDILKPAYAFGGLSMTQMAQPYVDIWLRTRESVGEIVHSFSVMVLKTQMATTTMPGGFGGGGGDVMARLALFLLLRDNQGVFAIDKETEDFMNVSAPISGLDALQAQSQEHMFSVGRIPAVKFAGIQPQGLNATSEGEMRAFNDTIHGAQEHIFREHLTTVYDLMQISLWGQRDPDITYDFLPLQEMTPKEKGELRKADAETDQIRIDSGVLHPEEVRTKVANDPESGYDGIDPDDVPDLLEEEQAGLIPQGSGKGLEAELQAGEGEKVGGEDEATDVDPNFYDDEDDQDVDDPLAAADEWNEADHPRGQPNNAGQFGPGGGAGGGRSRQMGEREQGRRQMGERESGAKKPAGERKKAQASQLYTAPTKTPDQIVASFPGAKEAIEKTRKRLAELVPTDALVSEGGFKNPDGTYTPERVEIHRKIAASFFPPERVAAALPAPGEKPVLTMLGGRGGSGKSWLTGEHGPVDESKSILIDADAIKGMLPGYEGWNASAFHEESSDILKLVDARALELGVNTIHDATMKSEATAAMRMAQYEAAGYEVEGYYMYAAPETAAMRALSRYSKKGTFTGRFVPPEIILGNVNNEKNFDKLSGGFRKWAVYDNNAEGKEGPKLISRSHDD